MSKIDPHNITNYYRTHVELELFLVFCIFVANKPSDITAKKVNGMFAPRTDNKFNLEFLKESSPIIRDEDIHSPFHFIHVMRKRKLLTKWLSFWKIGQYRRFTKTLEQIDDMFNSSHMSLKTVGLNQLMTIMGIGMKSARFFLLHSRPNIKVAVLDTHVLKWLRNQYGNSVPLTTPTRQKTYRLIEALFLAECYHWEFTAAEMDTKIWKYYNEKK
tara:strand:+ start:4135 stop:4779 length:645 start_codon:yes stop_codon:yes gene_type:complete